MLEHAVLPTQQSGKRGDGSVCRASAAAVLLYILYYSICGHIVTLITNEEQAPNVPGLACSQGPEKPAITRLIERPSSKRLRHI